MAASATDIAGKRCKTADDTEVTVMFFILYSLAVQVPSFASTLPLVNYKSCMYSGCTSTAAANSVGSSTNRRFTLEPRVVTNVPV